jgi:hypothetical protein
MSCNNLEIYSGPCDCFVIRVNHQLQLGFDDITDRGSTLGCGPISRIDSVGDDEHTQNPIQNVALVGPFH